MYSLCDYFKIDPDCIHIKRNEYNKPFISGHEDMHFNISHSGRFWICACSRLQTGVDIECALKKRYAGIIHSLHPTEEKYIENSSSAQDAFYNIWVRKEAVFKAAGTGIMDELNSFSVVSQKGILLGSIDYKSLVYYLSGLEISADSYSCICSPGYNEKNKIIYQNTL